MTAVAPAARATPAAGPAPGGQMLERFDFIERAVHWSTGILLLELLATGAILYIPNISVRVGHRGLVENIHVYSGLALLVPLVIGVMGPWRKGLVDDLRRFDRWTESDWAWFHPTRRLKHTKRVGKFNGGQKAEASLLGAGMVVMLVTGVLMRFAPPSWITWQQGATLVHDVGFIAITLAVFGHLYYALSRPEQLKSMITGKISRSWAERHAPAWVAGTDVTDLSGSHQAGRRRGTPPPQTSARRGAAGGAGTPRASG